LATAQQALELARARGNQTLVDTLQRQITSFRAGKPFRDEAEKTKSNGQPG
jgi:hypothetical protein